jgi:hypothetical protein
VALAYLRAQYTADATAVQAGGRAARVIR